ncbi:tetratricopeptide repeat protein [Pararhodonellum marinum]|uniref:tetratricopeptide repeat protein n=1 Tax=Pararhodonellum marinum TaxID=2755358 RepID=UPI00188F76DD|nr:tetratricopeptide repeat protein [Pararhodonellum marinum]
MHIHRFNLSYMVFSHIKAICKALFWLCFFLGLPPSLVQAQDRAMIDSLLVELSKSQKDTNRVWLLRDIAYYHMDTDLDSTIHYGQAGFNLAKELGFEKGQIWSIYQKALALEFQDKFEEAMKHLEFAFDLAEAAEDTISMAKLKNAMGVAYYYQTNFEKALPHYHAALDLSERSNYLEGAAHALNNLGVIYRYRRNFQKALDTYEKSLQIKADLQDTIALINSHHNLGLLYSYTQNFEKSLQQFSIAQKLSEDMAYDRDMAEVNVGLGVALYHLGEFDEAYERLKAGYENLMNDKIHEKAAALAYLGMLEIKSGKSEEGLKKLTAAHKMVENSERLELRKQVVKELANAYEFLGEPEAAIQSWKSYNLLHDSINNEQKHWAFEEMQARFEAIEKDKQIMSQEAAIAKEKSQNTKLMVVLVTLFLLSIGAGYYWLQRWKKTTAFQKTLAANGKVLNDRIARQRNGKTIDFEQINRQLIAPLTKRESEIIQLVEKGHTNHEIADILFVSENTIKTHLKNIFSKTHAQNRTDLLHKLRSY